MCLRKPVQASLGGRLGRFAIATMVQVRHFPAVLVYLARLA